MKRGISFYIETVVLIVMIVLASTVLVQLFANSASRSRSAAQLMGATSAARSAAEAFSGTETDETVARTLEGVCLTSDDYLSDVVVAYFNDAGGISTADEAALVAVITSEDELQTSGDLRAAHIRIYDASAFVGASDTYQQVLDRASTVSAAYTLETRSFVPMHRIMFPMGPGPVIPSAEQESAMTDTAGAMLQVASAATITTQGANAS